jgi:hypothetical protein
MSSDLQEKADRRFARALSDTGARDPRDFYRELLRRLKANSDEEYRRAVARFRDEVVGPVARDERDPLEAWLEFGRALAERLLPGRTVVVDETGRTRPYAPQTMNRTRGSAPGCGAPAGRAATAIF